MLAIQEFLSGLSTTLSAALLPTLLGVLVGLLVVLLVLMLLTPLFIGAGWLTNKPGSAHPSGFHMFTYIESGQVKLIVRGEVVVRAIMDTAGKWFYGEGSRKSSAYWKIEGEEGGKTSESPLAGIIWPLKPWAWYVYQLTGAVFTGIWPFQRVREYELERTKILRTEADVDANATKIGNMRLIVDTDWSDHYRIRQFLFPVHVTGAETADKIPLEIIGVAKAQFFNPHLGAFGTDRWDHLITNLILDAINSVTMTLNLDQVLTAVSADEARRINEAVLNIKEDELTAGIQITGFDIIERNPVLSEEDMKRIMAEGFAKQQGKATTIDGNARAAALRALNEANAAGGEVAIATMEAEAYVRAADAVGKGGGMAILSQRGGRGESDVTQTAILAELRKLNQRQEPK